MDAGAANSPSAVSGAVVAHSTWAASQVEMAVSYAAVVV